MENPQKNLPSNDHQKRERTPILKRSDQWIVGVWAQDYEAAVPTP